MKIETTLPKCYDTEQLHESEGSVYLEQVLLSSQRMNWGRC